MIAPVLNLDFTTGSLDPRVTFTRAGATATRVNSSGYIESVAADTPRFDYNATTLAAQGLLVEEQRTNILQYSQDFTQGFWQKVNGSITSSSITSPANSANANAFTGSGADSVIVTIGLTVAAATHTISVYAKVPSGTKSVAFVAFGGNGALVLYDVKTLTTTWQRFVFTVSMAAGANAQFQIGGGNTIGVGDEIHLWGAQLEQGAFATSYIPTTAAAATRNADVATITGANFSDWWQASKGGVLVRARPGTVSGTRPWVQFDDGTANEIIALRGNTINPELYIVNGGTPQAQIDAGTIAANTNYSLTGWWANNDCKARLDSGAVVTDTSATIPTVTQARLGSDGTNYLNGHLASISYYDSFSEQIYTRRKNKAVFNFM